MYIERLLLLKNIIINNISTSYYITEDGKCYNNNTGKYLKGQLNNKNGYFYYYLTLPDGTKTRQSAHRLVAKAYLSTPQKGQTEVNHIDGNKLNNCVDNLEWVSPQKNQQHAIENELRKFEHIYCFNKDKVLVAEYKNIMEASRATKISKSIIQQEVNKEIKTLSGGFYWSKLSILGKTKNYSNLGKSKPVNQYTLEGKYITTYSSTGVAAKAIHGNHSHIGECCRGKIKSYKGFVWKYIEDIVSPSDESQRDISEIS